MLFTPSNEPFPPVELADEDGCLAYSMELSLAKLIEAYHKGIFPWYNEGEPVIWWSPNPRMVLFPKDLKVSKSMKKVLRDNVFTITYNQNFEAVIENCRAVPRIGQNGTWITDEIIESYIALHKLGLAKSVEVWNKDNQLVGGLYGVQIKRVFCGESMFAKESNASKAGFISFILENVDKYDIIDCQVHTNHLESLGAKLIPRNEYLKFLNHE